MNGLIKLLCLILTPQEQYKLNIEMPDGTVRKVRSGTTGGFATGMVHQKYCDVIAAFSQAGSSTTYLL